MSKWKYFSFIIFCGFGGVVSSRTWMTFSRIMEDRLELSPALHREALPVTLLDCFDISGVSSWSRDRPIRLRILRHVNSFILLSRKTEVKASFLRRIEVRLLESILLGRRRRAFRDHMLKPLTWAHISSPTWETRRLVVSELFAIDFRLLREATLLGKGVLRFWFRGVCRRLWCVHVCQGLKLIY
jgi:hypothetical protein